MAVKNINALNDQAEQLLPDNTQQLISPADVRNAIKDLNDSAINRLTDNSLLGLKNYNPARTYQTGDGVLYNGKLYEALQPTSGTFNESHWVVRSSSSGTWGSIAGTITEQTDLQNALNSKQNILTPNEPLYISGNTINIQQANSSQNGFLSASDWTLFNNKANNIEVEAPLVKTGETISIQYVNETQDGILSSIDFNALKFQIIDITYPEAVTAVNDAELKRGVYYKISAESRIAHESGTEGDVILFAAEANRFGTQGYLISTLPRYESIEISINGIWNTYITPQIGDKYIYNGFVYNSLTGLVGTAPMGDEINWEFVPVTDPSYYKVEYDQIEYSIADDWISYRADKRGNKYSFSKFDGAINAIGSFQWGNDLCYGNTISNETINNINDIIPLKHTNIIKSGIITSAATEVRTYTLPDESGTIALLSDVYGGSLKSVTHSELLESINQSELTPGLHYLITDFKTVHIIPETTVVNEGTVEPIICMALTTTSIDVKVYSTVYPFDTLLYDLNDVLAEDTITSRKGKIIYRKDNINNLSTWYDFRNVKFRRWGNINDLQAWAPSTNYSYGQFMSYNNVIYKALNGYTSGTDFSIDFDANKVIQVASPATNLLFWKDTVIDFGGMLSFNPLNYEDVKTFTNYCKNIHIPKANMPYNNIVFIQGADSIHFGFNCTNMSIGGGNYAIQTSGNYIKDNTSGVIMITSEGIEIGTECSGIVIEGTVLTKIGSNCREVFCYSADNNILGNYVYNTSINMSSQDNRLESGTSGNILKVSSFNTIKGSNNYFRYASNNIIDWNSSNNTLQNVSLNSIGLGSNNNTIKFNSNNNRIGNASGSNTIEYGQNCIIGDNASANIIQGTSESSVRDNSIGMGSTDNSLITSNAVWLGNYCSSNSFDNSNNNKLANYCGDNAFINANSNKLGESCGQNSFNIASDNVLGDYNNSTSFNNSHSNNIGRGSGGNSFTQSGSNNLGTYCGTNTFNSSGGNILGNNCYQNTFINSSGGNVIGNYCSENQFDSSGENKLGNSSNKNEFNTSCSRNVIGDFSSENIFNEASKNIIGNESEHNEFAANCNSNLIGNYCSYNKFYHNASQNKIEDNCFTNTIGLGDYFSSIGNILMNGCNNIELIGSNNTFEQGCSFISTDNHMGYYKCYFAASSKNINLVIGRFSDASSMGLSEMRMLLPYNKTTILNINESTANQYGNKTYDKKDSNGDLWASNIDTSGIITTVKLGA